MLLRTTFCLFGLVSVAQADVLKVVTDIAPVHSLVSQVAGQTAEVSLILPQNASPHGYAMRPSEAAAIQSANLVVWVGAGLTPWLDEALDSLAPEVAQVQMLGLDGVTRLPFRETALFALDEADHDDHAHDNHDHDGQKHDDHDEDAHDDHDGHDHKEHEGHNHEDHDGHANKDLDDHVHDDHDEHAHDDHAGHDHGAHDPHVWLDPANAAVLVSRVAEVLAKMDPENAGRYRSNAQNALGSLEQMESRLTETLAPVSDGAYLVYHDAFQYFEHRFDLSPAGAISTSDAVQPGPKRLSALQEAVLSQDITCAFYEPQFSPRLIQTIADGTTLRQRELDPVGANLAPGPELYSALLHNMADTIANCLQGAD